MALKVGGTSIVDNSRGLYNLNSMSQSTRYAIWGNRGIQQASVTTSGTGIELFRYQTTKSRTGTSWNNAILLGLGSAGAVRIRLKTYTGTSGRTAEWRIRRKRNGSISTIVSGSTTSTTATNHDYDLTFNSGDSIDIGIRGDSWVDGKSTLTSTAFLTDLRILTSSSGCYLPVTWLRDGGHY